MMVQTNQKIASSPRFPSFAAAGRVIFSDMLIELGAERFARRKVPAGRAERVPVRAANGTDMPPPGKLRRINHDHGDRNKKHHPPVPVIWHIAIKHPRRHEHQRESDKAPIDYFSHVRV